MHDRLKTRQVECADTSWRARVRAIELGDFVWRMYIVLIDPFVVLIPVPFPLNQELQAVSEHTAVEDLFNVVLFDVVDEDWRWRTWRATARERVCRGGCEFNDMKNGMEVAERGGQAEAVGVGTNFGLYGEGPEVTMGQLGRRAGRLDVAGVEIDPVADLILGCRNTALIVVACHVVLSLPVRIRGI